MRISVRKDDPGYVKDAVNYEVFLNGLRILDCFTADEDGGIAFIYKRAFRPGRVFLIGPYSKEKGYNLIMEGFVRGCVVIKKKEGR